MSFAAPLVLVALLVVVALGVLYGLAQRHRPVVPAAFASPLLAASVAPHRPGWRRHLPYALLMLALVAAIVATARPRYAQTVPVKGATVMFANDISDSMSATDVKPSRLAAAKRAAASFLNASPSTIAAGSISFARHATLLQSPTRQHRLTSTALASLAPGGGGTAIGDALNLALGAIAAAPMIGGKRPPGAVILISDGASNVGSSPILAAMTAKRKHVKIYTVSIGTSRGTIRLKQHGSEVTSKVPVDPTELHQIAATSGGEAFRAADAARAKAVYTQLATKLGERRVHRSLLTEVAIAALVLLLAGLGTRMYWFGRLI